MSPAAFLLFSAPKDSYFKQAAFLFHLSQMFLSNLVSLESSPWGLGFLTLKMWDLLGISYQESASPQKQAVLEGYQSCCRGNSPRGGERFRNCSQPAWSTLWNPCKKEMVFLRVSFDIAILFLSAFQHVNCLERWGVKDLILRSLCRCCC